MNIYEEKGLRRVINASGRMTKLGVSVVEPEAAWAQQKAARDYVVIDELMQWASRQAAEMFSCGGGCLRQRQQWNFSVSSFFDLRKRRWQSETFPQGSGRGKTSADHYAGRA